MSELEWQYEQLKAAMEAGDWHAALVRADTVAAQLRRKLAGQPDPPRGWATVDSD